MQGSHHVIPTACILAGGLGTRLRALYADRPKALVPVCGRPFIEHMIEGLHRQGVSRIHIAAGYRAGQIKLWADHFTMSGVTISVSVEPAPLGTAGGIRFAMPFFAGPKTFLVLNGDSLLPHARLQDLIDVRLHTPSLRAVISAVEMTERGQYGTVEINDQNLITAFREKADNQRGFVNGGIYYLDSDILEDIPDGVPVSIEKDVFPMLAGSGRLGVVKVPGPLLDMGTPEGLERMNDYISP